MVKYENECVSCGFPCRHDACRYYRVKHLYCDKCGCEVDKLYILDDEELCDECVLKALDTLKVDD